MFPQENKYSANVWLTEKFQAHRDVLLCVQYNIKTIMYFESNIRQPS